MEGKGENVDVQANETSTVIMGEEIYVHIQV